MDTGQRFTYSPVVLKVSLLSVLFLLLSCDLGVVPPPPPLSTMENIIITQIYYDSVLVQSGNGFFMGHQSITKVSISEGAGPPGYKELTSTEPSYSLTSGGFLLDFSLRAKFDSSLTTLPLVIRYHYKNGGVFGVQRNIATDQYPYPSAEIFLTEAILPPYASYFQDVDKIGDKFYIHPTGPHGVYEYDLTTELVKELFGLPGGDHIAVDSPFVFADGHRDVHRYDLRTDSLMFGFINYRNDAQDMRILGMDIFNGSLYVLSHIQPDRTNVTLRQYSYDGVLLDSLNYITPASYYMTIHNDILYSIEYPDKLTRFDLSTRSFLSSIPAPVYRYGDGIKIAEGYLYYCDFSKRLVGRIPIEDILTAPALVQK